MRKILILISIILGNNVYAETEIAINTEKIVDITTKDDQIIRVDDLEETRLTLAGAKVKNNQLIVKQNSEIKEILLNDGNTLYVRGGGSGGGFGPMPGISIDGLRMGGGSGGGFDRLPINLNMK